MSGPGKEHRRTAPRSPPSLCPGGGRRAARSGAAGRTPWSGATQSGNAACGPRHLRDLRPLTSPSLVLPGRRWRQTHLVCRVTVRTASDRGRASVGGRDDAARGLHAAKPAAPPAASSDSARLPGRGPAGQRSHAPEPGPPLRVCLGCDRGVAGGFALIGGWGSSSRLAGCWQNSAPRGCRTEGLSSPTPPRLPATWPSRTRQGHAQVLQNTTESQCYGSRPLPCFIG